MKPTPFYHAPKQLSIPLDKLPGDKMLRIITSMESAIQQRPVTKLRMIWNLPKPRALTAWETVKESSGTTPEAAADI